MLLPPQGGGSGSGGSGAVVRLPNSLGKSHPDPGSKRMSTPALHNVLLVVWKSWMTHGLWQHEHPQNSSFTMLSTILGAFLIWLSYIWEKEEVSYLMALMLVGSFFLFGKSKSGVHIMCYLGWNKSTSTSRIYHCAHIFGYLCGLIYGLNFFIFEGIVATITVYFQLKVLPLF